MVCYCCLQIIHTQISGGSNISETGILKLVTVGASTVDTGAVGSELDGQCHRCSKKVKVLEFRSLELVKMMLNNFLRHGQA